MNYEVVDIEFVNEENVEEREVHVVLDNGAVIRICACEESFEQYNGTLDELKATIDIAESSVEWLHGGERPYELPY